MLIYQPNSSDTHKIRFWILKVKPTDKTSVWGRMAEEWPSPGWYTCHRHNEWGDFAVPTSNDMDRHCLDTRSWRARVLSWLSLTLDQLLGQCPAHNRCSKNIHLTNKQEGSQTIIAWPCFDKKQNKINPIDVITSTQCVCTFLLLLSLKSTIISLKNIILTNTSE